MTVSASLAELTAHFAAFTARRGFDDIAVTLGLQPEAADGETISFRMELRDAIAQANGMYAAAALFGAADVTGTLLAMQHYAESGDFPLAVQSSQNYLVNSKEPSAIATARLVRAGGSVALVEASVADTAGRLLMRASFTYVLAARALGR